MTKSLGFDWSTSSVPVVPGFVTKRDMQRMRGEIPLDPDQLESVFDTLDVDGNGYLTLEEFTEGFNEFLGLEQELLAKQRQQESPELIEEQVNYDDQHEIGNVITFVSPISERSKAECFHNFSRTKNECQWCD